MTWTPKDRIIPSSLPTSYRIRGICPSVLLSWPDAEIGDSADYSVDFSDQLEAGETLDQVAFSVTGGVLGWGGYPAFSGMYASAWITWQEAGCQKVTVTVRTSGGRTLTTEASIKVNSDTALLPNNPPGVAPNVLTKPDGTPLLSETGSLLLVQ